MATTPISSKHLGYLDGLRAIAALSVVAHHIWVTVNTHLHGVSAYLLRFFQFGGIAVAVFIVLSGFCLMLPVVKSDGLLRGGTFDFLKRRAWRILPPYYCAMGFSLLLIWLFIHQNTGTLWDKALPVTFKSIVTHLALMHDALGDLYNINYVFWSIAVEWRIYFFFPILVLGWRYLGPITTTLLSLVVSEMLFMLTNRLHLPLTLNYLGLFTMGMFAAAVIFSSSGSLLRLQKLPWGWITLLLILIVIMLLLVGVRLSLRDFVVGLSTMSFLILTSLNKDSWHFKMLSFPPLVFIGTFAYSIYLIHSPLLQILWQYVFAPLQPYPLRMWAALMFLGIPVIVATSYLFFLVCERPFLNKRKTSVKEAAPFVPLGKMAAVTDGLAQP